MEEIFFTTCDIWNSFYKDSPCQTGFLKHEILEVDSELTDQAKLSTNSGSDWEGNETLTAYEHISHIFIFRSFFPTFQLGFWILEPTPLWTTSTWPA